MPRYGTAMLLTSGVAADLDYLSYFGGPGEFLRFHRTLLHSLPGSTLIVFVVAATFYATAKVSKREPNNQGSAQQRLSVGVALFVCVIGAGSHIALDLVSGIGVQLFWPLRPGWRGWELLANIDPWILALLAAVLLLPELLKLVSEEIGERKKGSRGRGAAIAGVTLLVLYVCARATLQLQAVSLLDSREYHGRPPLAAAAFPLAATPFTWRGVITTDDTLEELQVSLLGSSDFDPDRAVIRYKPEPSPALDAGLHTHTAKVFLTYAKIPFASVIRMETGYRFELRDLRFPVNDSNPENIRARVDFNDSLQILHEELRYPSAKIVKP